MGSYCPAIVAVLLAALPKLVRILRGRSGAHLAAWTGFCPGNHESAGVWAD